MSAPEPEEYFRDVVLDLDGVATIMGRQLAMDAGGRDWDAIGQGERTHWKQAALHLLVPALPLITAQVSAELKRILQLRGWTAPATELPAAELPLAAARCPDCNGQGFHEETCPACWAQLGVCPVCGARCGSDGSTDHDKGCSRG